MSATVICLKAGPNRNGNFKRAYVSLNNGRIEGVTDAPKGGGHTTLEIKVAPSEVNALLSQAKRAGILF